MNQYRVEALSLQIGAREDERRFVWLQSPAFAGARVCIAPLALYERDGGFTEEPSYTVAITYDETELTGMAGAHSTVTYRTSDRGLVTMLRTGMVSTAMTFKAHHRSICTYETPYMPFSIGVHALTVDNRLDTEGVLKLDYIIEIKGARAERCEMTMTIKEDASL